MTTSWDESLGETPALPWPTKTVRLAHRLHRSPDRVGEYGPADPERDAEIERRRKDERAAQNQLRPRTGDVEPLGVGARDNTEPKGAGLGEPAAPTTRKPTHTVELVRPGRDWFEDHRNVAALISWLGDRGDTVGWGPDDYARLVEKPHKWTPEYTEMCRYEAEMGGSA